jgi:hypothetical protein
MSLPALQPATAPTALSDEEVVERVLAGDTSLFEILMRRYNQRLFRSPAASSRTTRRPRTSRRRPM